MEELFLGTVISYSKQRGFGYIEPDDTSDFGKKISCHWKSIKSSDKWPTLVKGMRVAFSAEEGKKKTDCWKTTEVYTEEGDEVNLEEDVILLNNGKKYKGVCKSYNKSKGEGLITADGKGPWAKNGLKVSRSDIEGNGGTPSLKVGQRVEFQVTKEKSGYRAVNVVGSGAEKVAAKKVSGKKIQKKGKTSVGQKGTKKQTRKRKLESDENPSAKKKKKVTVRKPIKKKATVKKPTKKKVTVKKTTKKSQLESGVYGGMEVDADEMIEVGILLKSHWVGSLIGKKGVTIREIKELSNATMQFGDEEIQVEGALYKVFAVSGTMNQVADACKEVAVKLGEASESLEYKIVFLVPDSFCGMFVGKKGATINEIRGEMDLRVRVNLSQDPIMISGSNKVTLCTVSGPRENVKDAIERTVAVLGGISSRITKRMSAPSNWGGNEWGGGYRNNREVGGWSQGGRRGNGNRGRGGRRGSRGRGQGGRGGRGRGRGRGARRGRGRGGRGKRGRRGRGR